MKKIWITLASFNRPFYFLLCGETISLLGIALMEFSLGVWVYQKTGSVLDFSGVIAASILPTLLVLPFAGKVADQFNRFHIMVAADITTAFLIVALSLLLWKNSLEVVHLYFFNMLAALAGAFRGTAYIVSASQLIPKQKYTQASGLMGMSSNLIGIIAPMVAGWLMSAVGLSGIVYINFVAFCMGSVFILKAFFNLGKLKIGPNIKSTSPNISSIAVTKEIFKQEPLLLGLFTYAMLLNAAFSLISIMMIPMILSHHTAGSLGIILTFGATGGLLGTMLLTYIDSPKQLMVAILKGDALLSGCILFIGITTSFTLYCTFTFLAVFIVSFTKGCSQSLWLRKIPFQKRGRVFSITNASALVVTLIVILLGGTFAESFFEPALLNDGVLATTLGPWFGTGKGRGLGLIFSICGCLGIFISLIALATPLRQLDSDVPDAN